MAYNEYTQFKKFLTKFDFGGNNDCWIWRGKVDHNKQYNRYYALFYWPERKINFAPIASYVFFVGEIPKYYGKKKLLVCHSCDNPLCVNPMHLWLGTSKQNTHDMLHKGRWDGGCPKGLLVGDKNGRSRLTWKIVHKIRKRYKRNKVNKWTLDELAEHYNVARNTIDKVVDYDTWKE